MDADWSASAENEQPGYIAASNGEPLDEEACLNRLTAHVSALRASSTANPAVNAVRNNLYDICAAAEGLDGSIFTVTAPTGAGKTLALLRFALGRCRRKEPGKAGKNRMIFVLPFLSLADQTTEIYEKLVPGMVVDHSQSRLSEEQRELTARWSAPCIVTTSVRFFESFFSYMPGDCRKLHNIANSVVVFDEAQSLPVNLTKSTLEAMRTACRMFNIDLVFSTATQPDFSKIPGLKWSPIEVVPDPASMYDAMRRVKVEWRVEQSTPLIQIAEEMSQETNTCAIVNLRKHARELMRHLCSLCPEESVFFLSSDLCPAHRAEVLERMKERQKAGLPVRVVSTQCIEAGVDISFHTMFRALAPLEAIIQAAG